MDPGVRSTLQGPPGPLCPLPATFSHRDVRYVPAGGEGTKVTQTGGPSLSDTPPPAPCPTYQAWSMPAGERKQEAPSGVRRTVGRKGLPPQLWLRRPWSVK